MVSAERPELSDTMHGIPKQTGRPNGVRSSDWLGMVIVSALLSEFYSADESYNRLLQLKYKHTQ